MRFIHFAGFLLFWENVDSFLKAVFFQSDINMTVLGKRRAGYGQIGGLEREMAVLPCRP